MKDNGEKGDYEWYKKKIGKTGQMSTGINIGDLQQALFIRTKSDFEKAIKEI